MRFWVWARRTLRRKSMDSRSWQKLFQSTGYVGYARGRSVFPLSVNERPYSFDWSPSPVRFINCRPYNMAHLRGPPRRDHYKPFGRSRINRRVNILIIFTSCCFVTGTRRFLRPVASLFLRRSEKMLMWCAEHFSQNSSHVLRLPKVLVIAITAKRARGKYLSCEK